MDSRPDELRVHLEAGLREHQRGNFEAARQAYEHVLAMTPDHPDALGLLGVALLQSGQAEGALGPLERAARLQRNNAGALGNLAQAYFALARYDDAEAAFRKAARLDPGNPQFQAGTANSLALQGKLDEAEILLRRLSSRFPGDALVWFNLGNVVRDRQQPAEAADCYLRALRLEPGHIDARNNLGGALQKLYRFEEAEREYRACVAAAPDYAIPKCNLASVLIDVGRFGEAEAVLREVIAAAPAMGEAHAFLGAALGHQGKLREALAYHREAARLSPESPRAVETYMSALFEVGEFQEGLRWLARARALTPDSPTVDQRAYSPLLAHGSFAEGWTAYAQRPAAIHLRRELSGSELARTLPTELPGKRVCLLREQGLGDEIFFLRYAALLRDAGARVTYRASNKIASIVGRAACLERVLEQDAQLPEADVVMLVGDLPHAWQLRAAQARQLEPVLPCSLELPPLPDRIAAMREQLAVIGPPPYIGLTWKGGTAPSQQQERGDAWLLFKQIPVPALAEALRGLPVTFVAVQRKPAPGELDSLASALGAAVHDFTELNGDLEGMQALLALIDDYVGVSNTNMHMRAAAGRTARVLVPQPAEWRWMDAGASSPWFPGFTVYRQSLDGAWDGALAALRKDLAAAVNETASR